MPEPKAITAEQLSLIIQAIKAEISSEEFYSKLISLVERMTEVNTQMVANQDELKRLVQDEVIPAFDNIETIDSEFFKTTCKDVNKLLHGDEHKFLDQVRDVKESNLIKFVKKAVYGLATLGTVIALMGGLYFIWVTFIRPTLTKVGV